LNRNLQQEIGERSRQAKRCARCCYAPANCIGISQAIGSARTPDEILAALLSSSYLTTVSRASIAIFTAPFDEKQPPLCDILAAWNKDAGLPNFIGRTVALGRCGSAAALPPRQTDRDRKCFKPKGNSRRAVRRRFELLKTA